MYFFNYIHPVGIGFNDEYKWWIPKFLAKNDPALLSYYGMAGEENRRKLAELFKRPTTWGDYCSLISVDNCKTLDETAVRAPVDVDEAGRYYVENLFKGYFRATEKNSCDSNPDW